LASTVLISFQTGPDTGSCGTGFLVFREIEKENSRGHCYLVTNRHVLPKEGKETSVSLRVTLGDGGSAQLTQVAIPVVGGDGRYTPAVRGHTNPDFDIAVVNVTPQVVELGIRACWLPYDLFVSKEKLRGENITVGDRIFLLGYPDAIYDPRNVWPILRQGVIATVPSEGYSFNERLRKKYGLPAWIDGFLIDATVFPGSSGSLVILEPQAATVGPGGRTVIGRAKSTPYLLGIVSGSIPIRDEDLGAVQRMGLGVVYSAEAIRETIEQFYKTSPAV